MPFGDTGPPAQISGVTGEPDPTETPESELRGVLVDVIGAAIQRELRARGEELGEFRGTVDSFYFTWENAMADEINLTLDQGNDLAATIARVFPGGDALDGDILGALRGTSEWYTTPDGIDALVDQAWDVYRVQWPEIGARARPTVSSGGGGGGSSAPTPGEIRNQFDLDQLADQVSSIWRTLVLEDAPDPRGLASEYVEAIVATGGEKALDFATFVKNRARQTLRYQSIYAEKPEAMSEEAFLQPYFNSAQQVLRPVNAAGVAVGGAQFGASAGAFADRLRRSNEHRTSSNFINELQGRLENLNEVFKG